MRNSLTTINLSVNGTVRTGSPAFVDQLDAKGSSINSLQLLSLPLHPLDGID